MFQKALQNINEFYKTENKGCEKISDLFLLLKNVVNFDKCGIFYLVPNSLNFEQGLGGEFSKTSPLNDDVTQNLYDTKFLEVSELVKNILGTNNELLAQRLLVKGVVFGVFCVIRKTPEFTSEEALVFETYSNVLAESVKEIELSKIVSMQVQSMEKGLKKSYSDFENIKKENQKIQENKKLQNEFIANVSHDLRTPLNSIICMSETLANNLFGELTSKQKEYVEDIRVSGIRLLGMINEVLDIAKIESHTVKLNVTDVNLRILVKEVCNILQPIANKKKVRFENTVKILSLRGDYVKLQQVLFNIIGNAIKFSPENSEVRISAEELFDCVEIRVKDEGIGIAKEYHKKIFEKFYQVENSLVKNEISTGLGLAISKEFVKLHGGEIEVNSEKGKGAEFVIKLPITDD